MITEVTQGAYDACPLCGTKTHDTDRRLIVCPVCSSVYGIGTYSEIVANGQGINLGVMANSEGETAYFDFYVSDIGYHTCGWYEISTGNIAQLDE